MRWGPIGNGKTPALDALKLHFFDVIFTEEDTLHRACNGEVPDFL
jgi:hypothetical protein